MSSTLSSSVRTKTQPATRRLTNFLDAAAELFAEIGYEADTMTAVAETRRFRRLTAGQLSRAPLVARRTSNGKSNAELGSIVGIVLSPQLTVVPFNNGP